MASGNELRIVDFVREKRGLRYARMFFYFIKLFLHGGLLVLGQLAHGQLCAQKIAGNGEVGGIGGGGAAHLVRRFGGGDGE